MKLPASRKLIVAPNPGGGCRAAKTFARAAGTGARVNASGLKIHCAASARHYLSQRDKFHLSALLAVVFHGLAFAADTNPLPKLLPAYGELSPTFWEQHQSAIIVAVFAVLAVLVLSLLVMLRPKMPVVLPPEAVARQALAKLQNQPEDGKILSEISQILHRYLCAAFGLPSAEMNTTEFSAALAASEKTGNELVGAISSFLRECDERKFSPPSPAVPVNTITRALELVLRSETRLAQLAATNPPQR